MFSTYNGVIVGLEVPVLFGLYVLTPNLQVKVQVPSKYKVTFYPGTWTHMGVGSQIMRGFETSWALFLMRAAWDQ